MTIGEGVHGGETIASADPETTPSIRKKPAYIIQEPVFSGIGSANLNCPHCNGELKRFPQRKTKCPCCDRVIYSRSRPLDRKKVLLNDDESLLVEEEWAAFNRHQHLLRIVSAIIPEDPEPVLSRACDEIIASYGGEPTVEEILWYINDRKSSECRQSGMFSQFRYHLLFSSDIRRYEGRDTESLRYLCQVIYLDMNGVSNVGGTKNKKVFTLKTATCSPDLLAEIRALRMKIGYDMNGMEEEFIRSAEEITGVMAPWTPPLTPQEAWNRISPSLD